jgi:hypothetical protein
VEEEESQSLFAEEIEDEEAGEIADVLRVVGRCKQIL